MARILVTGASGLLGSNLCLTLARRQPVLAGFHRHGLHLDGVEPVWIDVTDRTCLEALIRRVRPDWIVHCAAQAQVDECQIHPEEAFRLNAQATADLASVAEKAGSRLVYISTDAVFDGLRGMYSEEDPVRPINVYAQSKWMGEQSVRQILPQRHLIIRTSMYGWNAQPKQSLAEWMLGCLEQGKSFPGFQDVYFSPLLVNDLSDLIAEMIDQRIQGTYHVGGSQRCSKYAFARLLCETFGYSPQQVRPSSSEEASLQAPRPKEISLNVEKVSRLLGRTLPNVQEGLRRFRVLREEGFAQRLRSSFLGEPLARP